MSKKKLRRQLREVWGQLRNVVVENDVFRTDLREAREKLEVLEASVVKMSYTMPALLDGWTISWSFGANSGYVVTAVKVGFVTERRHDTTPGGALSNLLETLKEKP